MKSNITTIKVFLTLMLLSLFWISFVYYLAPTEHIDYGNILNFSVPQPESVGNFFNYLANRMNESLNPVFTDKNKGPTNQALHFNLSFGGVFVELLHISPSILNTFFIESKCATVKMASEHNVTTFMLNARQCCSVESFAKTNPRREVYILHTCPVGKDFLQHAPHYVRKLFFSNVNVHLVRYNMSQVFVGTPVQGLWNSGNITNSKFPVEHSSDILRLTMLWRFGGMYCDLDVVTIRSVDKLQTNYCGLESDHLVGNAILNFEPFGYGHSLLTEALQYLNLHFNGVKWAANGPELVTQMLLSACNITVVRDLVYCSTFRIYPQNILYPLHWKDYRKIFKIGVGEEMVKTIKETGFTIHLWNAYTHKWQVKVGSSQVYALIAEEFCPEVYSHCGDTF